MRRKDIRNMKIRNFVNLVTALMFTMYTLYHTFLLLIKSQNRILRFLFIVSFALIAAASFFALVPRRRCSIMRTVMLVAGLSLNLIFRLSNGNVIFRMLDFSNTPTVLNSTVFILSEAAELILLTYYLLFRHNKKLSQNRILAGALMSLVILLYLSCLIMEIVLLIKYGWNIDLSLKFTVASRFLYFFAYTGIAVSLMLPVPIDTEELSPEMQKQISGENELLFSSPDNQRTAVEYMETESTGEKDVDFIL